MILHSFFNPSWRWLSLSAILISFSAEDARAEFLRLGPVSFTAGLNAGLNYSTNVDQVPDGVTSTLEKEDYWVTYGFNLSASSQHFPKLAITANTSLSWERHFVRDDLDTESDPVGNLNISTSGSSGPWGYNLSYVRTEDLTGDDPASVTIGGRTQERKDRTSTDTATVGLTWAYQSFSMNGNYSYSHEVHQPGFEAANTDSQSLSYGAQYQLHPRISMNYDVTWEKDEFPDQDPEPDAPWLRTQTAGATFTVTKRPSFTITVALEREEEDRDRKGEWEPVYTFNLSDTRNLAPNLVLSGGATYSIEENPEEDDITFTYNGSLVHTMPNGWSQTINGTREPAQTFGSSTETDSTTWTYSLSQPNFLFQSLSMTLTLSRSIDQPPGDAPEETTDTLTFGLNKSLLPLFKNFNHSLGYTYTEEESNLSGSYNEHLVNYNAGLTF